MTEVETISVPNILSDNVQAIETFYAVIDAAPPAQRYVFDMRAVGFVKPYGVIALVAAARRLSRLSGWPVRLDNLDGKVHAYLRRMNLFDVGSDWLQPAQPLDEEWARNPYTLNLLELTTITGSDDAMSVISQTRRIFSRWLRVSNLGSLLTVLSELCTNIYTHSGDSRGCALIQKYEATTRGQVNVCLAVGDLGCGIRRSLADRHGEFGRDSLDYLQAAMRGKTSRSTGRGGLGLRRVEQIAGSEGGYLWLRSETAAIFSRGPHRAQGRSGLINVPGTQVAVEFHAPLRV